MPFGQWNMYFAGLTYFAAVANVMPLVLVAIVACDEEPGPCADRPGLPTLTGKAAQGKEGREGLESSR